VQKIYFFFFILTISLPPIFLPFRLLCLEQPHHYLPSYILDIYICIFIYISHSMDHLGKPNFDIGIVNISRNTLYNKYINIMCKL